MDKDIREYMTEEDQQIMDSIMKEALIRKEKHARVLAAAKQCPECGEFQCQREFVEVTKRVYSIMLPATGEVNALKRLLQEICSFCLKYDLCQCIQHKSRRKQEMEDMLDSDLPF